MSSQVVLTDPVLSTEHDRPDPILDAEDDRPERNWTAIGGSIILFVLFIALLIASSNTGQLGRLGWTALTIVVVLVASAALFVGSNVLVSQASRNWGWYRALAGAFAGAAAFGLLRGNRSVGALISGDTYSLATDDGGSFVLDDDNLVAILQGVADPDLSAIGDGFLGHVEWPILGLILGGLIGAATGLIPNRWIRIVAAIVPAAVGAWIVASNLQFALRPDSSVAAVLLWLAIGAVVGGAIGAATKFPIERALMGAGLGAAVGAWVVPDILGSGSLGTTRLALLIPAALLAARFAWPGARSPGEIAEFNRRARATIFLGPALLFLSANLVIPAIRTLYTSLLDRESEDFVGLDNFQNLVEDEAFIDFSDWTNIFTSQLFIVGVVLIIAGVLISTLIHRIRHNETGFESTGGSIGPGILGVFLILFAGFSVIRGTFSNTLWWALTVTFASTLIGLIIAVIAERAGRLESTAKSLIFMPMAVSFVGASIIWRFQYQPRNISRNQTGVLNAIWIRIGRLSHSTWPRYIVLAILLLFIVLTLAKTYERVRQSRNFAGYVTVAIVLVWLFVELLLRSLGGFALVDVEEVVDGVTVVSQVAIDDTVAFREHAPFNNVFLMVILIWAQAGFAMVILSAAIKAVPGELIEAAKIDGADESQQFFKVILPQILPSLGVVVTATVVGVAKVFDIVKVSTGGNFGTNVLANDFFTESFQIQDRGTGSAIAVTILITVAPILVFNIRQMQKEAV